MPTEQPHQLAGFEFSPTKNRNHIDQALSEVHRVLVVFVRQQMEREHGPNWRAQALEKLNRDGREPVAADFEQDPSKVLHLIKNHFRPFSGVLKAYGRTLIPKMIIFRNQVAHESEIDESDTFHAFDTFCKLLALLNHHSPEITAKRNALQLRLAQHDQVSSSGRPFRSQPPRQNEGPRDGSASWQAIHLGDRAPNDRPIQARGFNRSRSSVGIFIGGVACLAVLALGLRSWLGMPGSRGAPAAESRLPPTTIGPSGSNGSEEPVAPATEKRGPTKPPPVKNLGSGGDPPGAPFGRPEAYNPVGPVFSQPEAESNQIAERSTSPASQRSHATDPLATPSSPVAVPVTPETSNLVINGDFARPWDVGWHKELSDPTQGSFIVEEQSGMLHMVLKGKNTAQVWQTVQVPAERGLEGLSFEAGVKLIPMRAGMLGLAPPVETALILQFNGPNSRDVGQIWFTQFATTGFEDSGLAGVPSTLRATGQRCQIALREGFNRITESLDRKAKDCLARPPSSISSIMLGVMMRTSNPESSAEAFLDQVRLFYR